MIKTVDSGTEYAADDSINRAATLTANSRTCYQGTRTVTRLWHPLQMIIKKTYLTNISDNMGATTVGWGFFLLLSQYCDIGPSFMSQKGSNRGYL